ncbi:histidine kinase [Acinetobacter sp. ANC 4558]|uniref:two-component system sensor histidine kinase NtrB n=1 Tax=Acinetobacter sp. ANC 4558 TaxID=1977876 RepID=UPI000A356AF9|nr:ATP-binding protein [Acinetobacter sp. ANC 4558]OTG81228.1 histidine kinase [Acinetobacter sp. ANC 4558]
MHAENQALNQYHLGLWYGSYRFIISCCLFIVFLTTSQSFNPDHSHPQLYLFILILYVVLTSLQFIAYKFFQHNVRSAITLFYAIDILIYSSLIFTSNGPNLYVSLLFSITIFTASLLLESKKALFITLVAIIGIIYQHVVGSFFSSISSNNIGNSVLLSILFLFIYACGQMTIKRFHLLENSNFHQSLELNQLQNINRYILEQIETGYLVLDQNYHVVLSNPASKQLLGINTTFSTNAFSLYDAQPDLVKYLTFDHLKNGEKFQFTSKLSHYHTHITIQTLKTPQQTLILLIIQDTKRLDQQVQQLKLAALGQLSASIAHEIRNPLAAIVQANYLYLNSHVQEQEQLSNLIAKQALRINKIIEDTLGMVKSKDTLPQPILLDDFITRFIDEDLSDISNKIKLKYEQNLSILFDESQLRQILINLIRNAIRHNNPNYSYIIIEIYKQENLVRIEVKDFGDGIAQQDIHNLFQPFFSTEINGTGLGLYLSMSFCEANQAKLSYVEQTTGTCFRIECSSLAVI